MKKFFLLFAASAMLLSFVSCSNGDDDNDDTGTQTIVTTPTDNTDSNSSGSTDSNKDTTGSDTTGSNTGSSVTLENPFAGNKYLYVSQPGRDDYWRFTSDKAYYGSESSSSENDYNYTFDETTITLKRRGYLVGTLTYSFNEDKTKLTISDYPITGTYTKQ